MEARRFERPEASVDVVPLRSYPLALAGAHSLGRVGEITDRQLEMEAFAGIEPGTWWASPGSSCSTTAS